MLRQDPITFVAITAKKIKCIQYKGGKCKKCRRKLTIRPWLAHFHHRDPETKEFQISKKLSAHYSLNKLLAELDKCDLLCAGCHLEIHFPMKLYLGNKGVINTMVKKLTFEDTRNLTQRQIKIIQELAKQEYTLRQITKATGHSLFILRKYMPKEKFGNDRTRKITNEQLLAGIAVGLSLREIAKKYGVAYKTVWKRSKRLQ